LPDAGRLLFIGIFSNADDDGKLIASLKYLKAHIFPYDEDKTTQQIQKLRDQCVKAGLFIVYSKNGREYLQIPGWGEHQSIRADRYKPSKCPPPDSEPTTIMRPADNHRATIVGRSLGKSSIDKISIEEEGIINYLDNLIGWLSNPNDIHWLRDFRGEYCDFALVDLKACVDYYSGKKKANHKGTWKNRLRNWMIKKKEFEEGKGGENRGHSQAAKGTGSLGDSIGKPLR